VLVVENIVKKYGDRVVLNNVSLRIDKPMIYGLLGPNGAGKSTLLKIMAGVIEPDNGRVLIRDMAPSDPGAKRIIGYCPQEPGLYKLLSGWDNIYFYASLHNIDRESARKTALMYSEQLGLTEYLDTRVGKYSGGMLKKLGLIISLINDPEILLLDEPTTGLDPGVRREVWELLLKLRREGRVIVLATHYMEEAEELSDTVGIIDQGVLIAEGSPQDLMNRYGFKATVMLEFLKQDSGLSNILSKYGEYFIEDRYAKLYVDDPDKVVPKIVDEIYSAGYRLVSMKITKPTLEDVFLKLTGRRIED